MPLLNKTVDFINDRIKSSLNTKVLQNNRLRGIATRYVGDSPEEGKAAPIIPFVFDDHGDGEMIEFDGSENISAYHRILTNQYQDDPGILRGTDRGRVCISEMTMVICADRSKVKTDPLELEAMIESVFPSTVSRDILTISKLYKCNIKLLGSVMDPLQVFATEYSSIPFFIKPQQAYFSIRYKIESYFMPGCFNNCCN